MKNNYLSSSFNSVVSLDMDSSWAAKSWDLSSIYWNQLGNQASTEKQLKANWINSQDPPIGTNLSRGKVRKLFLERRGKGFDRSNPLEPIKNKTKPNRTEGQSPLTKSLGNLPEYYSNPIGKVELFSIPVKLPNIGGQKMQSQARETAKKNVDSRQKTRIPQPRTSDKVSTPPIDELRKLTLSARKIQTPERSSTPANNKPSTPGLRNRVLNQQGKMIQTPERSSTPANNKPSTPGLRNRVLNQQGKMALAEKDATEQKSIASSKSKSCTPLQSPTPMTPTKSLDPDMAECSICRRSFLKDRLKTHEAICAKSKTKKRKVFDPVKHRLAGTEAEPYLRKGMIQAKPSRATPPKPKSDWRKKHEEFIATIRAAKHVQEHLAKGGNIKDLPPPPPMDTSDYVQCPHCGRKFNSSVADRHIPICIKIKSNKNQTTKRIMKKK